MFGRLKTKIRIILFGHIVNWLWRPRLVRRSIRQGVLSVEIPKYLKRYLTAVKSIENKPIKQSDDKIFSIWLQGEENAPDIVRACFRSVRRNCKQELVVLDEKTLFEYITLPDYIMEKRRRGLIKNAHFADICRVELLYQYGGIWLDATAFVTAQIPDNIMNLDFFVYMAGNIFGYSFIQNCFIRARRGSYLLAAWRAMILEYWRHENHQMDYFVHQLLFKTLVMNDKRAKKYFDEMPHVDQEPTHRLWWDWRDKPFNAEKFKDIVRDAFYQKLTYRDLQNVIPGSFADAMINKM